MDFLKKVELQLDMPKAAKEQVLRELASHLTEMQEELAESGMAEIEATHEAEKRLGQPLEIAARLNAAHNVASWKSTLLCAVPFLSAAISYLLAAIGMGLGLGFVICGTLLLVSTLISVRELVRGRRPIWLSAWLAGSIYLFCALVFFATARLTSDLGAWLNAPYYALIIMLFLIGLCAKHWRIYTVSLGVFYILSLAFLWQSPAMVTFLGILVIAARVTFETHPHGSASRASLFLLTAFMLFPILLPFFWCLDSLSNAPVEMAYMAAKSILYACPILFFARTPSNFHKGIIALAALLLYPAFDLLSPSSGGWHWPFRLQGLLESLWNFLAVMSPIWLAAFHSRRNRLTIAH